MRNFKDGGYSYILTVIDVFSKYAWAIPIKRKTGDDMSNALRSILGKRKPRKLHTDKGSEFINKTTKHLLKENDMHWCATENETKDQVVELLNRTLKTRMWKYFTNKGDMIWVKVLFDFLHNYNTTKHRSIGMTPTEASLTQNEKEVYIRLFPDKNLKIKKPRLAVDNLVRITVKRGDFRKGYRPNFTKELFRVNAILNTNPIIYKIEDLNGEGITGSFYEQVIVKVNK